MKPDPRFSKRGEVFWANVRIISQELGYTERNQNKIKTYTIEEMARAMVEMGLSAEHLVDVKGKITDLANLLCEYFQYRSNILNTQVEPFLMNKAKAKEEFENLKKKLRPTCPIPMNKQKGKKRSPAYFTGIINMLIDSNKGKNDVDYDPRSLTVVTKNRIPIRTFCRRIDGCFPSLIDPVAVWEIKEYYNTTTFGSRVADAIYENILDGLEFKELSENENIFIKHYLFVDDHYTWWECGRSYLCRIIDLLNMGFVDEVLFGAEVINRLPKIVQEWNSGLEKR